ncbi:MAG: hypothetical protein A2256_03525 [Candidatus Staskawiczbacteria bacterium RIFOXYA2_FULL_32_7]|nr:MAG: hypothetical protein A2256_03525 [Candidatus Staskawiczbacteria bacterium RIFOXYA2_FULL_32_7]
MGNLDNGTIKISKFDESNYSIIKLVGDDNGWIYEAEYSFPEDYLTYENISFFLSTYELKFLKEYYFYKQGDLFSNVSEPHFKKTPITWKIVDKSQCWETEENKIRLAFSEIEKSTNYILKFQEVLNDADIEILCYTNFSKQYEKFKSELNLKKECKNITFDSKKVAVSSYELGIDDSPYDIGIANTSEGIIGLYEYNPNSDREYEISSNAVLVSDNETIWEVCKVRIDELSFDPYTIFDSNSKLNDYLIGEGGPVKSAGNIILKGEANFLGDKSQITTCISGFPLSEVHELLHVLGFRHILEISELSEYKTTLYANDILYPYKNCEVQMEINKKYSECLEYIYSNGLRGNCTNVPTMIQ